MPEIRCHCLIINETAVVPDTVFAKDTAKKNISVAKISTGNFEDLIIRLHTITLAYHTCVSVPVSSNSAAAGKTAGEAKYWICGYSFM